MRRGRGKGKRQNATAREDRGSGDEEKIPAYRRRGRPQKPVKDETEIEEEIVEKDDDTNGSVVTSKEDVTENGKKRKKPVESKESNITEEEEENGLGSKSSTDDSVKSSFRQIGSRRKNKPRRAAEAVVECNGV